MGQLRPCPVCHKQLHPWLAKVLVYDYSFGLSQKETWATNRSRLVDPDNHGSVPVCVREATIPWISPLCFNLKNYFLHGYLKVEKWHSN